MDCPETFGNLRKLAVEVSGRFSAGFQQVSGKSTKSLYFQPSLSYIQSNLLEGWNYQRFCLFTRNLLETSTANFRRFLEVSEQSDIDGPHGSYFLARAAS